MSVLDSAILNFPLRGSSQVAATAFSLLTRNGKKYVAIDDLIDWLQGDLEILRSSSLVDIATDESARLVTRCLEEGKADQIEYVISRLRDFLV